MFAKSQYDFVKNGSCEIRLVSFFVQLATLVGKTNVEI